MDSFAPIQGKARSRSRPAANRRAYRFIWAWGLAAVLAYFAASSVQAAGYNQTNLVSDVPGLARYTDPDLVNPWGIAFSGTSPIWISDNHTGLATIYNGAGVKQGLVVTIPPPSGGTPPASPTGQVFNGGSGFSGDRFVFSTEDGTIAGWQGALGTNAALRVDNSGSGAVYKGLALGTYGGNSYLYAANFNAGTIDVFDSSYNAATLGGSFLDPSLPAGYAPFNVQNFGGDLYVTYAVQDPAHHDDVPGAGHGFVDVFDTNGNLTRRLASNGALNSPCGLAIAPWTSGTFSTDLC